VGRAGRDGVGITLVEPRQHRLLKTIEKATKQKITVETLPTVADLRARRLELTRAALAETLGDADDNDRYRVVVDTLTDEHDLMEIALAAVRLVHEASGVDDADEIPSFSPTAAAKQHGDERGAKTRDRGPTSTIFVSLGHAAKIRPQDLVGAIANETSLSGRQIGAIEITHKFSTVEVPQSAEREVIEALRNTLIKGRKARVERYKPPAERYAGRTPERTSRP
jgi:ATP-dependent RNA helicase DeaD